MTLFNPLQRLILVGLSGLLSACASNAPDPEQAPATEPVEEAFVLPANQHEITGNLLNVPDGAEVELALLGVDLRGRPRVLLGNIKLHGNGQTLPFHLPFNPDAFDQQPRIELHGRANQSGQLILRLPAQPIPNANSQSLGELRLVRAP